MTNVLNEQEAAAYTGLKPPTLRKMRCGASRQEGPPFLKIGRKVGYRLADLDAWLERHVVAPDTKDS